MSKADILLLVLAIVGGVNGFREGFLMELIALVAVILGVFLGFKLMGSAMLLLEDRFNADKATLPYIAFGVVFVIVIILVGLMGKLVKNSLDKSFLGTVDQALGAALGAFRTLFVLSIGLWIVDSLKFSLKEEWVEDSWLFPFTARLAPATADWLGQYLSFFKEIFMQF